MSRATAAETPVERVWIVNLLSLRVEGPIEAVERSNGWYQRFTREQFGSTWKGETRLLWKVFRSEREAVDELASYLAALETQTREARTALEIRRARLDREEPEPTALDALEQRVVEALLDGPMTSYAVGELLGVQQHSATHVLGRLRGRGLVVRTCHGRGYGSWSLVEGAGAGDRREVGAR